MAVAQLVNIQTLLANLIGFMKQRALRFENQKVLYSKENKIIENEITRKYDQYKKESFNNIKLLEQVLALTGKLMRELTPDIFSMSVLPPKVYKHYVDYLDKARSLIAGCKTDMRRLPEAEKILIGMLHRVPDIRKLAKADERTPAHL